MTKKHFIALADAIRDNRALYSDCVISKLASWCWSENHRFNETRWLSYIAGECGPNGGAIKPAPQPRTVKPKRKLARRLEGQ